MNGGSNDTKSFPTQPIDRISIIMHLSTSNTVAQRAAKLFKSGLDRPALDILERELSKSPEQADLLILQASILHSQAHWKSALAAIETAMVLVPLPISGLLVLADCYSYTGKHELALLAYKQLLREESLPLEYYAGLYAGFTRAENHELALDSCRKAIELSPENDEAYFGMAHCMSRLAYPPRQIASVLKKAVKIAPNVPHYRISLVLQLIQINCYKEAYKALSAKSEELLTNLSCRCIARQLLNLCASVGDISRSSILGGLLAQLSKPENQS